VKFNEQLYKDEIAQLEKEIQAPCESCNYDGEFKCNMCAEELFTGYNMKDYPILENMEDDDESEL
jgi:hypothetical protein